MTRDASKGTRSWAVLELSPVGDRVEDPQLLVSDLKRHGATDVFVPMSVSVYDRQVVIHRLMEGYVFAKTDGDPRRLASSAYIQSVLCTTYQTSIGQRDVPQFIEESEVARFRQQLAALSPPHEVGASVRITGGPFRDLIGRVVQSTAEGAVVEVALSTFSKQITLPHAFIQELDV